MLGVDYVVREFNNAQNFTRRSAIAIIGGMVSSVALPVFAKQFETNGVAINGTDPVAYFTMSKPVQGSAEHALSWNGVTWHFASGENRQMFKRDPEKYAPQYGWHCAYAMSKGYIASTVPEAWTIYEDRLYLNFPCGLVNYGYKMFRAISPWGMRIGQSLRKKKRATGPL